MDKKCGLNGLDGDNGSDGLNGFCGLDERMVKNEWNEQE